MRLRFWIGVVLLTSVLAGCAGPHEAPKTADLLFPIPWILKQPQPLTPTLSPAPAQ